MRKASRSKFDFKLVQPLQIHAFIHQIELLLRHNNKNSDNNNTVTMKIIDKSFIMASSQMVNNAK